MLWVKNMILDYKKLRVKLAEKDKQWQDLNNDKVVSWGTIARIRKGESITLSSLGKIAKYLECEISDIVDMKI